MKYAASYLLALMLLCTSGHDTFANGAIHLSHENSIKYLDDSFLVTCKDESGRVVSWSGPKGPLSAHTHPSVSIASYGTSIMFKNVQVQDSGVYTCKAEHDSNTFSLTVKAPLKFMDTKPVQTGREGTDVTLRCEVKGGDEQRPIVNWIREDGEKLESPKYQVIGDGLLIKNVSRNDSKTYVCMATQPSTGDIKEQKINLTVEHKPYRHPLWAKDVQAWGFLGGEVHLTCAVEAEPAPTFEWYYHKKQIHHGRIFNHNNNKSVLHLTLTEVPMFGSYLCRAKNNVGTLDWIFDLQQGVQPPPPEYLELRGANADLLDVGIHGAIQTGKPSLGMEPIGYNVQYRPKGTEEWQQVDFPIHEDNSYALRELQHSTIYEIRAATKNKAGISVYTNISRFNTFTSQADAAISSHHFLDHLPLGLVLFIKMLW